MRIPNQLFLVYEKDLHIGTGVSGKILFIPISYSIVKKGVTSIKSLERAHFLVLGTPIAIRDRQLCLYRAIVLNTWSGFNGFGAFHFV